MTYVIPAWHCLRGSVSRHCEKSYVVIRRSNPVKNSDLQNFFIIFSGLPRRFAPRNDDLISTQQCLPASTGMT
ncbi:hypothetical protein [Rickettsia hoogstraalii]|uniref:hypothetical protein n=1 Tax=Rickettsia hoogstraalii TaxID=467174 RepID=UPI000A3FF72E|nr:hypothetical protein [Rickettsia hoogstraalii]